MNINIKKVKDFKKKKKQFRIRSYRYYLTYSRLPTGWLELCHLGRKNMEYVLVEVIKRWLWDELFVYWNIEPLEYSISIEQHKDGRFHTHIYLEFNRRVQTTSLDVLHIPYYYFTCVLSNDNRWIELLPCDYINTRCDSGFYKSDSRWQPVKGHYEGVNSKKGAMQYLMKEGSHFWSSVEHPPVVKGTYYDDPFVHLYKISKKKGVESALEHALDHYPDVAVKNWGKVRKNLEDIDEYSNSKIPRVVPIKNLDTDFCNVPSEIYEWIDEKDDFKVKSLLIYGTPGSGKTQLAKAVAQKMGRPWVILSGDIDCMRDALKKEHEILIYDDVNLSQMDVDRETIISLTDIETDRYIRARYKNILIRAGTRRMFVTNYPEHIIRNDPAIRRRVTRVPIVERLFEDVKVSCKTTTKTVIEEKEVQYSRKSSSIIEDGKSQRVKDKAQRVKPRGRRAGVVKSMADIWDPVPVIK